MFRHSAGISKVIMTLGLIIAMSLASSAAVLKKRAPLDPYELMVGETWEEAGAIFSRNSYGTKIVNPTRMHLRIGVSGPVHIERQSAGARLNLDSSLSLPPGQSAVVRRAATEKMLINYVGPLGPGPRRADVPASTPRVSYRVDSDEDDSAPQVNRFIRGHFP